MKSLSKYQRFDFEEFSNGKEFAIVGSRWNERRNCITLSVVITADETRENLYEKFNVHLIKEQNEARLVAYHIGSVIEFVSVGKVSVYGDYHNQLSVEAEVEIV